MNEKDLQVLTYNLFERTGEFIYGIYQFLIRNPVLMKFLRQKSINHQTVSKYFKSHVDKKTNRYDDDDDEEDDYELPQDQVYIPPVNSTLIEDKNKIELLEKELNQLRNQMAMFLKMSQNNEEINNMNQPVNDPFRTPVKNTCPPPPPPPPPVPPTNSAINTPKKPIQRETVNPTSSHQVNTVSNAALSLAEMVKLSGRKNLRKVEGERSPGGTIKRDKKEVGTPSSSHSDIIADALKRKFKNISSPVSSPDKRDGYDEFE